MNEIKFSFIVPVYNVEQYLKRCVDSLYNQTYSNFEVICVNDGSTDNSYDILKVLQQEHPDLIVVNQQNGGLGAARNTGVRYVTGDYIWFVDSDDWIVPDSLQKIHDTISSHNLCDMVVFDCIRTDGMQQNRIKAIPGQPGSTIQIKDYLKQLLLYDCFFAAWGRVFKTDTYKKSGFEFPKGFYEDVALVTYYPRYATEIVYLHEDLYYYYYRPQSITQTYDSRIFDLYIRFDTIAEQFAQNKELSMYLTHFFYYISVVTHQRAMLSSKEIQLRFKEVFKERMKDYTFKDIFKLEDIKLKRKIKLSYFYLKFLTY